MTKQSVNFTSPNDDWLNAKVESKEYPNKTDIVNDLIRREREREEKFQTLKRRLRKAWQVVLAREPLKKLETMYLNG